MPIDLPAGYLTRPEAAKKYNRSQRALERDLDVALAIQDAELLAHWKLVTKDGQARDGGELTVDMVKELVTEGMTPAWCVAETFLEEKFGRKGEPRPGASTHKTHPTDDESESRSRRDIGQDKTDANAPKHAGTMVGDVPYLKEIIRRLEREQEQERERHDRIVTKLFEQLAVKDKQISAWDEVTQGLTKALATGQIAPQQTPVSILSGPKRDNPPGAPSVEVTQVLHDASKDGAAAVTQTKKRVGQRPNNGDRGTRRKSSPAADRLQQGKDGAAATSPSRKHKWYETPTLKRLFSRP